MSVRSLTPPGRRSKSTPLIDDGECSKRSTARKRMDTIQAPMLMRRARRRRNPGMQARILATSRPVKPCAYKVAAMSLA
jgi:hypothetical protein